MTFGYFLCRALAAFRWLFDLIIQNLAAQAIKPVTLGPPLVHRGSSQVPNSNPSRGIVELEETNDIEKDRKEELATIHDNDVDSVSSLNIEEKADSFTDDHGNKPEDVAPQLMKGPLKKMVSINDNVEVIAYPSKDKKRKKATEKSPSMEREKDEETKPLKSILKVASNLSDKQQSEQGKL